MEGVNKANWNVQTSLWARWAFLLSFIPLLIIVLLIYCAHGNQDGDLSSPYAVAVELTDFSSAEAIPPALSHPERWLLAVVIASLVGAWHWYHGDSQMRKHPGSIAGNGHPFTLAVSAPFRTFGSRGKKDRRWSHFGPFSCVRPSRRQQHGPGSSSGATCRGLGGYKIHRYQVARNGTVWIWHFGKRGKA